jgi:ubiquinone/menaquinone biosynthesis C-methylase UbiE
LLKGTMSSLYYDEVASEFDRRYELYAYPGVQRCLLDFVSGPQRLRVLEVGCGTGRWLVLLDSAGHDVAGIEPSDQMLARAQARVKADLRHGTAEALPWPDACFDRVIYVNVFHHLADPRRALQESFRVLRPGGRLLSVGRDPHWRVGQWYIYEYFPEALAADLARFPSRQQRTSWLLDAGFTDVAIRVAERLKFECSFQQAFQDGALDRSFTSQLGILSADEYAAGMRRISEAAERDDLFTLTSDFELYATEAAKPV